MPVRHHREHGARPEQRRLLQRLRRVRVRRHLRARSGGRSRSPRQRLFATIQPDAGVDLSVNLVLGPAPLCEAAPRGCLVGSNVGLTGQLDSVAYNNNGSAAQSVFVVADSMYPPGTSGSEGLFDLSVSVGPFLAGDVCPSAVPILASGTLSGQTTYGGFVHDYEPVMACTGYQNPGPERVYSIDMASGQTLSVTATLSPADDLSLYLLAGHSRTAPRRPGRLIGEDRHRWGIRVGSSSPPALRLSSSWSTYYSARHLLIYPQLKRR